MGNPLDSIAGTIISGVILALVLAVEAARRMHERIALFSFCPVIDSPALSVRGESNQ
jgi:hypothetical protein